MAPRKMAPIHPGEVLHAEFLEARLSALGAPCFLVAVGVQPFATPAAGGRLLS